MHVLNSQGHKNDDEINYSTQSKENTIIKVASRAALTRQEQERRQEANTTGMAASRAAETPQEQER